MIVAEGLAAAYGSRLIWQNASFSVDPGEFVAVLGPNGSGKSTLLRLLLGLLPPAAGHLTVLGKRPHRGNAAVGYVPQRRNIDRDLPVRGRDFVHLGIDGNRWGVALGNAADIHQRVDQAIASVEGLGYADRAIGRLSGGEQQRLLLAQALLGRPKLLLLDEPLISLDPHHQRTVVELTRTLQQQLGIAVLFTAHEINPLLGALDRVLYLGSGQAALGAVEEVITGPVLARLYGSEIDVVRVNGRIFVMSGGYDVEHDAHQHDHNEHHVHV